MFTHALPINMDSKLGREGITRVVALVKGLAQCLRGAAQLTLEDGLAFETNDDFAIQVDEFVVQSEGQAAVVALRNVDDIVVYF